MIKNMVKKVDRHIHKRCDELSPPKRKWIVISLLGLFTTIFICNLIMEFL